jgi:hypothetical protein
MNSQIDWSRVIAGIAFIELNDPSYVVWIIFRKIVHIALNKKGYFKPDVFEV